MLLGLHPLLTGDLLAHLDALGHGDLLAVVDANFPARKLGRRVVRVAGADAPSVARAIFTVAPADPDEAIAIMIGPGGRGPVHEDLIAAVGSREPSELSRHAFYSLAAEAELVVVTGEGRAYGNICVHKAAIAP